MGVPSIVAMRAFRNEYRVFSCEQTISAVFVSTETVLKSKSPTAASTQPATKGMSSALAFLIKISGLITANLRILRQR